MILNDLIKDVELPFIIPESIGRLYAPIDTVDFQNTLKKYIGAYYGKRIVDESIVDITSISSLQDICNMIYLSNQYRYVGLYNSTQQEYNPIENYSMTEEEISTKGEQINTNSIGEQTITNNLGAMQNKEFLGAYENSNTHSVTPYESDTFHNESKDTINNGSVTNTYNTDARVDSMNNSARNDTITDGKREDARTLKRSGNIGVTTSQQMIESERSVVDYVFYKTVAQDIIHLVCVNVWGAEI